MLFYKSLFILVTIILALPSCGFKPLHGVENKEAIQQILEEIYVVNNIDKTINTLDKKLIYQSFIAELGIRTVDNQDTEIEGYKLEIRDISESDYPLDLDRDGQASEYNYTININVALLDKYTQPKITVSNLPEDKVLPVKKVIYQKSYNSSVNLNVSGNYYASQVSKRSYRKILAKNIATELKNYLLVNFSKIAKGIPNV